MIKINNNEYQNYTINIYWDNYESNCDTKQMIGKAPFIEFQLSNQIVVGIEFSLCKDVLESIKLNSKKCIKEYISDILYKKDNGWMSLVNEQYNCNIIRLNKNDFQFDFCLQKDDMNLEISSPLSLL